MAGSNMQSFYGLGLLAPPPSSSYGWGGVSLESVVGASPCNSYVQDQSVVLTPSNGIWTKNLTIVDPTKPITVALVWTDRATQTMSPTPENDLRLTVYSDSSVSKWVGNNFSWGYSPVYHLCGCRYPCCPPPTWDHTNNVEKIVISPSDIASWIGNTITVGVSSQSITGDGIQVTGSMLQQDFAVVVLNARDVCP